MPRKRAPLTRRIPDEKGVLVTYLSGADLQALIGVSKSCLKRWRMVRIIRFTPLLKNEYHYSVLDAIQLRSMSRKEVLTSGIRRSPESHLRVQRVWYNREQYETKKRADHHGEIWDDYDIQYVIDSLHAGKSYEDMALVLGRSYSSVNNLIDRLKRAGELEYPEGGADWYEQAYALLTSEEREALSAIPAEAGMPLEAESTPDTGYARLVTVPPDKLEILWP
jgi:hypothetical protein